MNKEQIQELILGAAVVALGYALWKNFKGSAKVSTKTAAGGVTVAPYGAVSPFTSLTDLLTGTVSDIGAYEGVNYLGQLEAGSPWGNGPRQPGAMW
jgi:hypothetical protein